MVHCNPEREPRATHVNLEDMLRQTFGQWDTIADEVAAAEEARTDAYSSPLENNALIDDDDYDGVDEDDIP
jgi:hypothetical protein